jgi:hypothetical protein
MPMPVEAPSLESSDEYVAITKSDDTVLVGVRALYVGGAGDVAVRAPGSSTTITFVGVPAGTVLPIVVGKVMAATTATSIVGLK